MPHAFCVQCNREAALYRVYDGKTGERHLNAICHGQTQRIEFADAPDVTVRVFAPPAPCEPAPIPTEAGKAGAVSARPTPAPSL